MDIMYILGSGSTNGNFELKHALRSIEKNLIGLDRVFVVGEDPGFLSEKVIFVPCKDPYKQKHKNMLYKIMFCVQHTDISETFLVSSDDIFIMQPMKCSDIPCYHQGDLPKTLNPIFAGRKDTYEYNLWYTGDFLRNKRYDAYKFAIHTIHVISRKAIEENLDFLLSTFRFSLGVEPFCLLNNIMLKQNPNLHIEKAIDEKIVYAEGHDDFCMKTRRKLFFSCNDEALENGGLEVIDEYWPNKSRWEK